MTDLETDLNEEELELLQQARLLEMFLQIQTYDGREAIITACEKLIEAQRKN